MTPEIDEAARSRIMSSIRGKNTAPEVAIRRLLWREGYRYRIHDGSVPGRPDLSHKGAALAVFIDGCFWHGCPQHYVRPRRNRRFWDRKLKSNVQRREKVLASLLNEGWTVLQFWECQVASNPTHSVGQIASALDAATTGGRRQSPVGKPPRPPKRGVRTSPRPRYGP